MEAYSMDLRQRVAQAVDEGKRTKWEISLLFRVSPAWIRRLLQRRRETGSLAPKPRQGGGPKPKLDQEQRERLKVLVREDPDATLAELCERVHVKVSVTTMCRVLAQLGLPLKKSRNAPASRIGPTSKRNASSSDKR
jgi:transposase